MLINTIILFLRDALPVFWLMSLLLAQGNSLQQSPRWIFWTVPFGLIFASLLMANLATLSNLARGAGLEWLTFLLHGLIYALVLVNLFLFRSALNHYWQLSATALGVLTISINGSYFLVFLDTYWRTAQHYWSLITGTILGFGVCFSAGILIYLLSYTLLQRGRALLWILLLLLWSSGQLIFTFNLLAQANIISATSPIWNTSEWIADSSELGMVLNTLMGYEATPTLRQIVYYLLCVLLPLLLLLITERKSGASHKTGVSQ